ncbi:MAG: hypothetical protein ABIU96_03940 [Rhodanobacter sp.]
MSASAAFTAAHADLIAVMGDPPTYTPVGGGSDVPLQAVLDRHTAEVGEYGQTVAYRPSIAVLSADVPKPAAGDVITFTDPITDVVISTWTVLRIANADEYVTTLWVELGS